MPEHPERRPVTGGGHVLPFPPLCMWCDEPALADTTCPSTIRCPRCDARPGDRCRLPNGHATVLHRERRREATRIGDSIRRHTARDLAR